jgi:two-component SAPR family response regulator
LQPAGIRLQPVGLTHDDLSAIAELVDLRDPHVEPESGGVDQTAGEIVGASLDDDLTIHAAEADTGVELNSPGWDLLVRLIGPVDVVSASGVAVEFERSKTKELVAWLATHRDRATRTSARTALWELDVRDATFSNVVSEARRSLARIVEPPVGEEWVGRTLTESLPLHDRVLTDADLIEHALDAARLQPPAQAIATLTPAVEWIAGAPFEGTSYLWPDAEGITSNLVLLAISAAGELAAHCLSVGDIEGVFAATGRGLNVLPGHEELIALRMRAYARSGDHAGVRQEWESYERVITADPWSDGEPSPKLVDLRKELLNPSR